MLLTLLMSFASLGAAKSTPVNCQIWHEAANERIQVDCHNHEVRGYVDLKTPVTSLKVTVMNGKTGTEAEKEIKTSLTLKDVVQKSAAYKKQMASVKTGRHEKSELSGVSLPAETQLFEMNNGSKMMAQNLNSSKKVDRFVASEKAVPQAGGVRGKKK